MTAEVSAVGKPFRGDLYPHYYEGTLITPGKTYLIRPLLEIDCERVAELCLRKTLNPPAVIAKAVANFVQCHLQGFPFSMYPIYQQTSQEHLKSVHTEYSLAGFCCFQMKERGVLYFEGVLEKNHRTRELFAAVLIWVKSFLREMAARELTVYNTPLTEMKMRSLVEPKNRVLVQLLENARFKPSSIENGNRVYEVSLQRFVQ